MSDTTNSSGFFLFENVVPYTSSTIGSDLPPAIYDNASALLDVQAQNIVADLTIDIHGANISGIITDAFLNSPLANAEVTLYFDEAGTYNEISTVVTSADGHYEFSYLYEGDYQLVVNRSNYNSADTFFALQDFESANFDIPLQRSVVNFPISSYSATPQTGEEPLQVTFTNNSTQGTYPIISWEWDFDGDGQTDTTGAGSYLHTYTDTGSFNSSLTVSDGERFGISYKSIVVVNQGDTIPPTSNFVANPPNGYNPITVNFTDISVEGTNPISIWEWDFNGDGQIDSTGQGPYEYTYINTGNFNATLTVSDGNLSNISSQNIAVNVGVISGTVQNTDNDFIKNAIITIYDENDDLIATDTTSSMGVFSLQNFSSDHSYSLECTKAGYQPYVHPNPIGADSTDVFVELAMIPNAILGTVKYENLEVEDAVVKIKDQPGNVFLTQTNEFGDFVFTNVSPEYYDVWALSSDTTLVSPSQSANLSVGQSVLINIDLELAAHIVGTITHNSVGKPGVSIYASNIVSGRIFSEVTNTFGIYDIPLPHGTYNIDVILEGFTVNEPMPQIQLQAGEVAILDFSLTGINNSISGTAVNSSTLVGIGNVKIVLNGTSTTGIQVNDSLYTGASGSFTFSNLYDGNYTLNATHNAYYPVNPIDVTLSGGVSNPPTVDFSLEPKDLVFYGTVIDTNSVLLSNAIVYAIGVSGTYADTTSSDGAYSIEVDTIGVYTLHASKFDYYPSDSVEVELTFEQSTLQLNFMLAAIPHYASINGAVTIFDTDLVGTFAPDSAQIILTNQNGDETQFNLIHPDSLYEFADLLIPDVFSIECFAYYLDGQYQTQIQNFEINVEGTYTQNFDYTYSPDAVSLSGTITMNVNERSLQPIANAEVILTNASGNISDTVYSNQNGFYQFNNLSEDQYSLSLIAEYEDEIFSGEVPNIPWTGEDLVIDYSFDFILCSIEFHITENGTKPVSGVNVQIIATDRNLLLITDETGFCETDSTLHTGIYSIKLTKPSQDSRKSEKREILADFINPLPYQLSLDSLSHYSQPKQLPLQFDPSQIVPTPASEPFEISLIKATNYTDSVFIHYYDVTNNYFEDAMTVANDSLLVYTIPIQNQSGEIEFWFSSFSNSNGLNYTNQAQPLSWDLTSEGILSQQNSTISPNQATLAYNQETFFEVNVFDDMNNSLNSAVDLSGTVIWSLTDSIIGNLEQIAGEKRLVKLTTPDSTIGEISGKLKAKVTLNDVSINLLTDFIYVRDMHLNSLTISGVDEINNNESYFFSVTAISDSGWAMTVPIEWDSIPAYCGIVEEQISGVLFTPNTDYLGQLTLNATATDPNHGFSVSSTKSANVFEKLTVANLADTLHSGQNCDITLADSMLTSGTAKLYLTPILASPMKLVSTTSELKSSIFLINSNRSPSYFNYMPGVIFTLGQLTDSENMYIAFWDENQLNWVDPLENNPRTDLQLFLPQIPDWHEYGVVGNSKSLGIYDLQLLPNPFTPHDQIGNNMGLQIIFKISSNISRYPEITAKIYNLNGTLIRTIIENSPMIKGDYKAGEQHTLHWDGKTDNGKMARNGRYVIQLIAEDAKNREELVKTIVLIK
ncbi:MAG: carboxypeptidase regulatory-like domain-containing protein [Candidatus Cloacimonadota bacterium]|nr:carboxypeptidase regulatory-like domain-containing protein [Candidatus Cloacimonadota bacterium]